MTKKIKDPRKTFYDKTLFVVGTEPFQTEIPITNEALVDIKSIHKHWSNYKRQVEDMVQREYIKYMITRLDKREDIANLICAIGLHKNLTVVRKIEELKE